MNNLKFGKTFPEVMTNNNQLYEEEKIPHSNDEPLPLGFDERHDSNPTPERTERTNTIQSVLSNNLFHLNRKNTTSSGMVESSKVEDDLY